MAKEEKIIPSHEQDEELHQAVWYPEHPPRTESEEFRRNKRHLVRDLDLGCWICGSRSQREVHHFAVEWALAEDADWDAVTRTCHAVDPHGFSKADPDAKVTSPDSILNLMVLCETHHRAPYYGVHSITMPIWIAQRIAKPGVQITVAPT